MKHILTLALFLATPALAQTPEPVIVIDGQGGTFANTGIVAEQARVYAPRPASAYSTTQTAEMCDGLRYLYLRNNPGNSGTPLDSAFARETFAWCRFGAAFTADGGKIVFIPRGASYSTGQAVDPTVAYGEGFRAGVAAAARRAADTKQGGE